MVKNLIWRLVAVGVVLAWFSASVKAAEPNVVAKTTCPKECERRAKAALALAATAPIAVTAKPATAPAPRAKLCSCEDCKCRSDACPAPCPVAPKAQAIPQPMPAAPVVTYREVYSVDRFGNIVRTLVPCPNGQCPTPR